MNTFFELAINSIGAFAIFAVLVLAYAILGAWANINLWQINDFFDRKKFLNSLFKYFILAVSTISAMLAIQATLSLAPKWGIELANADQYAPQIFFGILSAGILAMAGKFIKKLAEILSVEQSFVEQLQKRAIQQELLKSENELLILDCSDLPASVAVENEEMAERGRGAVASVDISSPQAFRNATIGRGFDVDGYYGAQCWDLLALFWMNAVGRTFSTGGTQAVRGGFEVARNQNAGSEFEIITDRNALKYGDFLIFGGTKWGHGGMAVSGNLGGYVRLLGQNQVGDGNGAPANEINMSLNNFLGAFRFKKWNTTTTTPAPAKAEQKSYTIDEIAVMTARGDFGNGEERTNNLRNLGFDPNAVQAKVNEILSAGASAEPAQPAPQIPNNPQPNDDIQVGDTVIVNGAGTGDSYGGSGQTMNFENRAMKVLGTNNGRYALNQYNAGTVGNVADATGWFTRDQIRK